MTTARNWEPERARKLPDRSVASASSSSWSPGMPLSLGLISADTIEAVELLNAGAPPPEPLIVPAASVTAPTVSA